MRKITLREKGAAIILAVLLVLSVVPLYGCTSETKSEEKQAETPIAVEGKVAIIHTNDTHGFDVEAEPVEETPGVIGMATVPALKADYESRGYEVIVVDDGDAIQGNNLVNLSKGETAIEFMNSAGYQAMSLGNHEFDWGADNLEALQRKANFPLLASNIIVDATGEHFVDPNMVVTLENGAKVGFFALTTPETQTKSSPKSVAGLTFLSGEEMYACAQEQVDELKAQGCEMIICLGHLGHEEGSAPNRSTDVIENTTGIDVFIDGHDHEVNNETIDGTLLVSSGCYFANIGVVLFEDGKYTEGMVEYGAFEGRDETTETLLVKTNNAINEQLSEVIATSTVDLNGERESVRTQETNLGDFAADASLWQAQQVADTDIDAAIVNGGSIRASIPAGDISMSLLKTVFPYDNSLNVVSVTGAQLLEVLEAATYCVPETTASFPQVAGITFSVNTGVPYENGEQYPNSTFYAPANPGARVTISDVGGKGFSLEETYVLAVSSFLTDGGDSYYVLAKAYVDNGYITGINDSDMLTNYINSELGGIIDERYVSPQQRVTIL